MNTTLLVITERGSEQEIVWKQALHYNYIAPHAVQLAVLLVYAYLAKTERAEKCAAGSVFHKDARDYLPEARPFGLL